MKFEYVDDRECVAYIDHDGDLVLKNEDGSSTWISSGDFVGEFDPYHAKHKFYRGGSVTITF